MAWPGPNRSGQGYGQLEAGMPETMDATPTLRCRWHFDHWGKTLARILPISMHKVRIEHPHASWSFAFKCHCHCHGHCLVGAPMAWDWMGLDGLGLGWDGMGCDAMRWRSRLQQHFLSTFPARSQRAFPIRVFFSGHVGLPHDFWPGLCFCLFYSCSLWLKNYALAMAMGTAKFRQRRRNWWRRSQRSPTDEPNDLLSEISYALASGNYRKSIESVKLIGFLRYLLN